MKKYAFLLTLAALFTVTSCSKDDLVDNAFDEKGKFELTIDGKKVTGDKVTNVSAIGVRTISAENDAMSFNLILSEDEFITGKVYDLEKDDIDPMIIMDMDGDLTDEGYWGLKGTLKIVSKTRIEINANFYENWNWLNPRIEVSGYISSK